MEEVEYAKIKKTGVLENKIRKKIHDFINKNPGKTFSQIMNELDIQKSKVQYHLKILMEFKLIIGYRSGQYKRFFNKNIKPNVREVLHPKKLKILKAIDDNEELVQVEIIEITKIPQSTVSRHLKELVEMGFIDEKTEDGVVKYHTLEI